ncbi:MAG: hypothetical protein ACT4QG_09550 [Sporichthyaceae bacterium]
MPTYERLQRFIDDWNKLTEAEQIEFREAVKKFIDDLQAGRSFRAGLRVKPVEGVKNIYEMTWRYGRGKEGRATWQYGTEIRPGEPHIVWRRIGRHEIYNSP